MMDQYGNDNSQLVSAMQALQSSMNAMVGMMANGASSAYNMMSGGAANMGAAMAGYQPMVQPVGIGGGVMYQQPGIFGGMMQAIGPSSPPMYMTPGEYQSVGIEAAGTRLSRGAMAAGMTAMNTVGTLAAFDLANAAFSGLSNASVGAAARALEGTPTGMLANGMAAAIKYGTGASMEAALTLPMALKAGAGLASAGIGMAASTAPFLVAGKVGYGAYESLQENWAAQDTLQRNSFRYFRGNQGRGFNLDERQDAAKFIQELGVKEMTAGGEMGDSDINKLMKMPAFNTYMNGTRDLDEFKSRMKELVKNVKEVALTFNETMEQAAQTTMELRRMGYTSPGSINEVVRNIKGAAKTSGFTTQEVMQFASNAGQQMMGTTYSQSIAANATTQAIPMIADAVAKKEISADVVANMGGVQGLSAAVTRHATGMLINDKSIQSLSAAAFDTKTGKLDMDLVNSYMRGEQSIEQLSISGAANLASPEARVKFDMAKPELTKQLSVMAMPLVLRTATEEAQVISRNTGMDMESAMYTAIQSKTGGNVALTETYMAMMKEGPDGVEKQISVMKEENRRQEARKYYDKHSLSGHMYRGAAHVYESVASGAKELSNDIAKGLQNFDDWFVGNERYTEPEFLGDINKLNEMTSGSLGINVGADGVIQAKPEKSGPALAGAAVASEEINKKKSEEALEQSKTSVLSSIVNKPFKTYDAADNSTSREYAGGAGVLISSYGLYNTAAIGSEAAALYAGGAGTMAEAGAWGASSMLSSPLAVPLVVAGAGLAGIRAYQKGVFGRSETLEKLAPSVFSQDLPAGQVDDILGGADYWQKMKHVYGFALKTSTLPEYDMRKVAAYSNTGQEGAKTMTETEYNKLSNEEKSQYIANFSSEKVDYTSSPELVEERRDKNFKMALESVQKKSADEKSNTYAKMYSTMTADLNEIRKADTLEAQTILRKVEAGTATEADQERLKEIKQKHASLNKTKDAIQQKHMKGFSKEEQEGFKLKDEVDDLRLKKETNQITDAESKELAEKEAKLADFNKKVESGEIKKGTGKGFTNSAQTKDDKGNDIEGINLEDEKEMAEEYANFARMTKDDRQTTASLRAAMGVEGSSVQDSERMVKLVKKDSQFKAIEQTNQSIRIAKEGASEKEKEVYAKFAPYLKENAELGKLISERFGGGKSSYDNADVALVTNEVAKTIAESGKLGVRGSDIAEKVRVAFVNSKSHGANIGKEARQSEWGFLNDDEWKQMTDKDTSEKKAVEIAQTAMRRESSKIAATVAGVQIESNIGKDGAAGLDYVQDIRNTKYEDLVKMSAAREETIKTRITSKIEGPRGEDLAKAEANLMAKSLSGVKLTDEEIANELKKSYKDKGNVTDKAVIDADVARIKKDMAADSKDSNSVKDRLFLTMTGSVLMENQNFASALMNNKDAKLSSLSHERVNNAASASETDVKKALKAVRQFKGEKVEDIDKDIKGMSLEEAQRQLFINDEAVAQIMESTDKGNEEYRKTIDNFMVKTAKGMNNSSDMNAITTLSESALQKQTRIEKLDKVYAKPLKEQWEKEKEKVSKKLGETFGEGSAEARSIESTLDKINNLSKDELGGGLSKDKADMIGELSKTLATKGETVQSAISKGLLGSNTDMIAKMNYYDVVSKDTEGMTGKQMQAFIKATTGQKMGASVVEKLVGKDGLKKYMQEAENKLGKDATAEAKETEAMKLFEASDDVIMKGSDLVKKAGTAMGGDEDTIFKAASLTAMNEQAVKGFQAGEQLNSPGGATPGAGDKVMNNWVDAMKELAGYMKSLNTPK